MKLMGLVCLGASLMCSAADEHVITTITMQNLINILHAKAVPEDAAILKKIHGSNENLCLHQSKKIELITNADKEASFSKLSESDVDDMFEEGDASIELCGTDDPDVYRIMVPTEKYKSWHASFLEREIALDIERTMSWKKQVDMQNRCRCDNLYASFGVRGIFERLRISNELKESRRIWFLNAFGGSGFDLEKTTEQCFKEATWQWLKNEHGMGDSQARYADTDLVKIEKSHKRRYCTQLALECISAELPRNSPLAKEVRGILENFSDEKMNSKQVSLILTENEKQISRKTRKQIAAILAMAN